MPHSRSNRIRAGTPWDSTEQPILDPGHERAESQEITYQCPRCGPVTRTYAANIRLRYPGSHEGYPPKITCRCGQEAGIPGASDDDLPETTKYGYHEYRQKGRRDDGTDPWSQLLKRRTVDELETLLAQRLAEVKASGAAR